jgi:cell division protein FtsN
MPMDSRPSAAPAAGAPHESGVEAGYAAPPQAKTAVPAVAAPAASPSPADNQILVVVSSFHTRDRAAQVATEIVGLGLPGFVRTNSGWQEVVVGPYSSRDAAVTAQKKLAADRYPDTKIVDSAKLTP